MMANLLRFSRITALLYLCLFVSAASCSVLRSSDSAENCSKDLFERAAAAAGTLAHNAAPTCDYGAIYVDPLGPREAIRARAPAAGWYATAARSDVSGVETWKNGRFPYVELIFRADYKYAFLAVYDAAS